MSFIKQIIRYIYGPNIVVPLPNSVQEINQELKTLHATLLKLQNDFIKAHTSQLKQLHRYRELCIKRSQIITDKSCVGCYPGPNDYDGPYYCCIDILPLRYDQDSLIGDYKNTVYLCGKCGRPNISMTSYKNRRYISEHY